MNKIAFLSFDWNYQIISGYYKGMVKYLQSHDDMRLFIFNGFGKYGNYEPEDGSFEVFTLCHLQEYDGIILQGNRSWPVRLRQNIVDAAKKLHKPVISLNYELDGAYYVGTNNYDAMKGLVERVLSENRFKDPVFINGLMTSVEAQDRKQAFLDACKAHGYMNPAIYQGNWQMEEGMRIGQQMIDENHIPDMIFCCNDDLAAGVIETFRENNIHVPQDVCISGFDNRDISMRTNPRITTIDRDYENIGYTALKTMRSILKGEEVENQIFSDVRYILSESCGFINDSETKEMWTSIYYHMDTALKDFYEMLTKFQPEVLNADSISEILHVCETYFPSIGCPDVYLNINDDYLEYEVSANVTHYSNRSNLMAHFGKPLGFSYDYKHFYKKFDTKHLLPEMVEMDQSLYMIYPLRQNTICIGYMITEGLSPSLEYGFLNIILTLISSAIESARKKEILQRVNSRLDDLYVHDHLTGLFNRFGLNRFGQIAYEHLLRDFKEAYFIFVDVDDMKQINDAYGHEIGDLALQDTANIIHRATSNENAFAMRYGGDEFLLIARKNLIPKLQEEMDSLVKNIKRPYVLSLSMGACKILESDHYSIKQCIEKADEKMYAIKKEKKIRVEND